MARLVFSAVGEGQARLAEPPATPRGLYELGLKYCLGLDVESDLVEAHKWFNLAALRGNPEAREYRGEIAQDMTKLEISKAQRRAREWLQLH